MIACGLQVRRIGEHTAMRLLLILILCCSFAVSVDAASQESQKKLQQRIALLISGLSDMRSSVHERAIQGLSIIGKPALPDLEILSSDKNPQIRLRVALVLSQIRAEEATPLLLTLSEDPIADVREVAALGLGGKKGDTVLRRAAILLDDENPGVRESAALAMSLIDDGRGIRLLANSFVSEIVPKNVVPQLETKIKKARSAKFNSLKSLCMRAHHIDDVSKYINKLFGPALHALLEITWEIGDPRLCEPLLEVLKRDIDMESHRLATVSLRANGDSRCLKDLCIIASSNNGPRKEAAHTLSLLTGAQSGPGRTWAIWWRDNKDRVQPIIERDILIANLHDPKFKVSQEQLLQYKPKMLHMIIDGILGEGAKHWSELAWKALLQDKPERWTSYLLMAHKTESSEVKRIGLLLILHRLGDPAAKPELQKRYEAMDKLMGMAEKHGNARSASNSERLILELFAEK